MLAARWREHAARGPRRSREGPVVAARGGPRGGGGRGGLHGRGLAGWLGAGSSWLGPGARVVTHTVTHTRSDRRGRPDHTRAPGARRAPRWAPPGHPGRPGPATSWLSVTPVCVTLEPTWASASEAPPRTSASRAAGAAVSAFAPSASARLPPRQSSPSAPRASGLAGSPLASQSPWARHQGHVGEGHGGAHQGERDGRPSGPAALSTQAAAAARAAARPRQGRRPACPRRIAFAPPPPPPPCPGPPGPPAWPAGAP
jgi:hypothetical protein